MKSLPLVMTIPMPIHVVSGTCVALVDPRVRFGD